MAKKKIEHWQDIINHINDTWKAKKKSAFNYPFSGRDMRDLAHFARIYQPWGIMALWDEYIVGADEWTIKMGLSISVFIRQLPRLVDTSWKVASAAYERKLLPPLNKEIAKLTQLKLFSPPKKRIAKTTRIQWLIDRNRKKSLNFNEI